MNPKKLQDDVDIHLLYEMAKTMKPLRISLPTTSTLYTFPPSSSCVLLFPSQVLGDKIRAGPEDKSTLVTPSPLLVLSTLPLTLFMKSDCWTA